MKFLFSGKRFHALLKTAPEHSSKQGKGSTFALCLLDGMAPKPHLPAQALWLLCESAGFVIVMGSVFIGVVILWYDMLVTVWCAVPFQNFVVIPDVLQVSQF